MDRGENNHTDFSLKSQATLPQRFVSVVSILDHRYCDVFHRETSAKYDTEGASSIVDRFPSHVPAMMIT